MTTVDLDMARKQAQWVYDYTEANAMQKAVAKRAIQLADEIERLRKALAPFAKVFSVYLDNGLDEARPEWETWHGTVDPEFVELLSGRGEKELLTLADMKRAHDTLEEIR